MVAGGDLAATASGAALTAPRALCARCRASLRTRMHRIAGSNIKSANSAYFARVCTPPLPGQMLSGAARQALRASSALAHATVISAHQCASFCLHRAHLYVLRIAFLRAAAAFLRSGAVRRGRMESVFSKGAASVAWLSLACLPGCC